MKSKKISAHLLLLALFVSTCVFPQSGSNSEEDLRSAVIMAMLRFTTWKHPEIAAKSTIQICSFGAPLSQSRINIGISKTPFFGKKLKHLRLSAIEGAQACEVLILGPKTGSPIPPDILNNTFSICDGCTLNKAEVVASLELIEDSIKFNINLYSADKAGVKLSSDLLILANKVNREPDDV